MTRKRTGASASKLFRIEVRGEFGDLLGTSFDDVSTSSGDGRTVLTARVRDEQQLYGILDRLRDLGIHIIGLHEVSEDPDPPEQDRRAL